MARAARFENCAGCLKRARNVGFLILCRAAASRVGGAEALVVVRDRILVGGRGRTGAGGADLLLVAVCGLAELEFQLVDLGEDLGVELFNQGGIAGEPAGIELLHLAGELLDLFLGGGVSGGGLAKLGELTGGLGEGALGVGGVGSRGGIGGGAGVVKAIVAGVEIAPDGGAGGTAGAVEAVSEIAGGSSVSIARWTRVGSSWAGLLRRPW